MFRKFIILLFLVLLCLTGYGYVHAGPIEDCSEYTVLGIPSTGGELLCRKGYLLIYNTNHKTADWVIEHLTAERLNTQKLARVDTFAPDPDLPKIDRAELSDYLNSGFDRGHMAPSADMAWDKEAMAESFYLSNMVPQVGKGMNRGIWMQLEKKVRNWTINRGELFVITGPIYSSKEVLTIGDGHVAVPSHLYKIIFNPINNAAIAFIMPNIPLDVKDMPNYIVTIRDVESLTGLNFLSALDQTIQDIVETSKADTLWQ
jgi:endonuclease G, mitochondrial